MGFPPYISHLYFPSTPELRAQAHLGIGNESIWGLVHQNSIEDDFCESYGDDSSVGFQDISIGDTSLGYAATNSMTHLNFTNICTNSHLFCFLSTLSGFSSKEHKLKVAALEVSRSQSDGLLSVESTQGGRWAENKNWSLVKRKDFGRELFGRDNSDEQISISKMNIALLLFDEFPAYILQKTHAFHMFTFICPLLTQKSTSVRLGKKSEMMKSSAFDVSPPHVEISPLEEFFFICLRHHKDSFIGSDNHSEDTKSSEKTESGNKRTGSLGSGKLLLSEMKVR
ncbi:hypothetical protein DKX38_007850 [Salix brachista]|uniref:Uncharacterized protein n=1 Tax=Salix brachista TaxID=2182728 RepID=A0A5N5MRW2_9ROSI|nr:hypothetical protein DKX38_007850 [Salix brachista]